MAGRRVLLFGITGINKAVALERLKRYRDLQGFQPGFVVVDFTTEYIIPRLRSLLAFLDTPEHIQLGVWHDAWEQFLEDHPADNDVNVIVALHGVLVRNIYGVRAVLIIDDLRRYHPTHVVTLIDDVYVSWQSTHDRAQEHQYKGTPTVDQLLEGRRCELMVGDLVAQHVLGSRRKNIVLAVRHPARLLDRILFGDPTRLRVVYLSFPISDPRSEQRRGSRGGVNEVNAFLREATNYERARHTLGFFCPLAIDELPLIHTSELGHEEGPVEFDTTERWNVEDFFSDRLDIQLADPSTAVLHLPREEVSNAAGMIRADVGRRDYRLVEQADVLLVYNPVFRGAVSKGVQNEIRYANDLRVPVHIYQAPEHDPEGRAREIYPSEPGVLGDYPYSQYFAFKDSVDALLESVVDT